MSNTIQVNCTKCGYTIENVTYLPGFQELKCPNCKGKTYIKITEDGRYYASEYEYKVKEWK